MKSTKETIIFISHSANTAGGAEKSLFELAKDAKDRGFRPVIVVPDRGGLQKMSEDYGIKIYVVNFTWWATVNGTLLGSSDKNSKPPLPELIKIILKEKPVLTVTNTIVVPWLAYASSILGVRHAWIAREFGDGDHGLDFNLDLVNLYRTIDLLSDKLFCNSNATKKYFSGAMSSNKSIDIIFPYVQAPKRSIKSGSLSGKQLKIGLVGQIKRSKGQIDAIKAMGELVKNDVDVELFLIGDVGEYDYSNIIESYSQTHHLESRVHFTGYVNDPSEIVNKLDVLLVCSKNEAFGRVTVEAMLSRKPVVAAGSGGTLEIVDDGKTGLLYTPGDYRQLAKQIYRIYEDRDLAKFLSNNALRSALSRFSLNQAHASFFSYLNSLSDQTKIQNLNLSPLMESVSGSMLDKNGSEDQKEITALKVRIDQMEASKGWQFVLKLRKIGMLFKFK